MACVVDQTRVRGGCYACPSQGVHGEEPIAAPERDVQVEALWSKLFRDRLGAFAL